MGGAARVTDPFKAQCLLYARIGRNLRVDAKNTNWNVWIPPSKNPQDLWWSAQSHILWLGDRFLMLLQNSESFFTFRSLRQSVFVSLSEAIEHSLRVVSFIHTLHFLLFFNVFVICVV